MKSRKTILLALFVIFTSWGCKGEEVRRCELPKGLIPYELGQIISFFDSSGQTFDATVTESNTKWIQESTGSSKNDYTSSEKETVTLKSETNNLLIQLIITIPDCCLSCKDYTLFNIDLKDMNFVLTTDSEGNFLDNVSFISFHESFEINGNVYYDVVEVNREYNVTQLFYNKTCGILQINRDGENFLTINPKTDKDKETNSLDVPKAWNWL